MPAPAPTEGVRIPRRSAAVAAFLGWLVPGLGQVYVGRPAKGLLYFVVLCGTYVAGLWLAGWTCVNPERDPYWFAAQALAGGPTAVTAWLTRGLEATERLPTYDVGLLYVTVAALLNAVAVSDALGTVCEYRQARAEADARRSGEAVGAGYDDLIPLGMPLEGPGEFHERRPPPFETPPFGTPTGGDAGATDPEATP